ncbi:cytochrome P450 [Dissoconium aciculare CBS 342.82]|uniref:Cytochrome P450 n=1 Tax=Dissoconium aciculare CBS 342.82 TaxID=1314786 RepID=A0A6J3M411_9PEZI|nr:cytochrome P450 [Dissoconium aciculare CBS 342.82]KAF1822771.1 cytochrome P450 [Dissoconium aciculare CBS 342.82]
MYTIVTIVVALLAIIFAQSIYNLINNLNAARRSNLPHFILPFDQNAFVWVVASVPLRPWLKKNLPAWLYHRVAMTIYGFEFSEKRRMRDPTSTPRAVNQRTYALVTTGHFEINTRDPELASEILRRPKDFQQPEIITLFLNKFGHNLLTSNGEDWSRQRKIIASAINERISKTVFEESVQQTRGLLEEIVGDAQSADTTRMFDAMKKITINVLSGAGMGARVQWREDVNEKPRPGYKMTYIEACKTVINNMNGPIILPSWFLANYPSSWPGHDLFKRLSYAVKEFPIHTKDLLAQEKERAEASGGEARNNIMSQLLQATSAGAAEKKGLTDDETMGNLFVFTAAGFDTTANTLAYAIMLMSRYPQWQKWVLEEVDEIMPKDETTKLDYLTVFPKATRVMAVLFETLRLFPPLVHMTKETKTAQTLTSSAGTYYIPPKTTVYVNTVGLALDPEVFRNLNLAEGEVPSKDDELAFRPTRWINAAGSAQTFFQAPKGVFIPWSAGPRVCPGQKMAQVEFTSIFLTLLWKHRIEAVPIKTGSDKSQETSSQVNARLEALMSDSSPIMTLQMNGVYDVADEVGKGVPIRVIRRK